MPNLAELDLNYNKVGDEGCRELAKMGKLAVLGLDGNKIGDIGVGFLSQLASLQ